MKETLSLSSKKAIQISNHPFNKNKETDDMNNGDEIKIISNISLNNMFNAYHEWMNKS